jgi:hypothetical protein
MTKQHATTLEFEANSVGKLTNVIWGEDWDAKYFVAIQLRCHLGT